MYQPAFVYLVCSFALVGCSCQSTPSVDTAAAEAGIMEVDIAMSEMAIREGFYTALLHYADETFVKFDDGSHDARGKEAFARKVAGREGTKSLSWYPVEAKVSACGDLGYTWGNWKLATPDSVLYGNYFSVWKLGQDGRWKLALDGGNSTPPPTSRVDKP